MAKDNGNGSTNEAAQAGGPSVLHRAFPCPAGWKNEETLLRSDQ